MDVLGGLDVLKICVGYRLDGQDLTELPASASALERCVPVYLEMPGFPSMSLEEWLGVARRANAEGLGLAALPSAAQAYVSKLEALLGVRVSSVGVGPDRDATIDLV